MGYTSAAPSYNKPLYEIASGGPYYDPSLNTPEQIAARKADYERNGGNLTYSQQPYEGDPYTPHIMGTRVDTQPGINRGIPTRELGGDPDTTGGEYQPTVIPQSPIGNLPTGTDTSGFTDWLTKTFGQNLTNITSNPQLVPALLSAYQYMNQAGRYGDRGEQLAASVDPWGKYRPDYAQRLNDLYADPSSIENTPGYKFRLSQGMGKTASATQAKNGGWGNEFAAMENYAQGLASTEFDNEAKRLMQLGGANLDPTNAAKIQLDADRNQIEAERAALSFLGTALAPQPTTNVTNNNAGGSSGGGSGGGSGVPNPSNLTKGWTVGSADPNNSNQWILPNGTVVDIAKLYQAAAAGDKSAQDMMKYIQPDPAPYPISDPIVGPPSDLANPPEISGPPEIYGPPEDLFTPPEISGPPDISIPDIEDSLGSWFDP